ncbi:hypothetical protein FB107DRAFT_216675, partial [Schizophyllum commune]
AAFTRRPSLQRIDMNFRDSVLTQDSNASSSVYPLSTSTASMTETPSPRSFSFAERELASLDPEVDHIQDFNGDDVSYRLRLLVKNNYWLPPAHYKPKPSDLALPSKKPQRSNTPAFLDLFRIGKGRKPGTPDSSSSSTDGSSPALRTPPDAPVYPRSAPATPRVPQRPATSPGDTRSRPGRVVVVRERMDDLSSAAKAAEQEIKTKAAGQGSQQAPSNVFDGVVDPTDAVDVPPPSSSYFAVQTSEVHGLGVQESVGAALLADRLPPSSTSTLADPENAWRKQLLHAAVDLSLNTSPESSRLPSPAVPSWPTSSLPPSPNVKTNAPHPKVMLDRRIIRHPVMMGSNPSEASIRSLPARPKPKRGDTMSKPSEYVPERAATPSTPLIALAPAPRSNSDRDRPRAATTTSRSPSSFVAPRASTSTTPAASVSDARSVRKVASSPHLSGQSGVVMTPPPIPGARPGALTSLSQYSEPRTSNGEARSESRAESTYYSDMDVRSQTRSPPTSAFHTALNDDWQSFLDVDSEDEVDDAHVLAPPRISVEPDHEPTHASFAPPPRSSSFTPPPRTSTSSNHFLALSPAPRPPRKGSLLATMASISSPSSSATPFGGRRSAFPGMSLDIPSEYVPADIHSAPPIQSSLPIPRQVASSLHIAPSASSPQSFFDAFQDQAFAQELAEEEEEEEDESELSEEEDSRYPPSAFSRARAESAAAPAPPRPSFMRLGNHSLPHVGAALVSPALADRLRPVENKPEKSQRFFTDLRSEPGHANSPYGVTAFASSRVSQQRPATATTAAIESAAEEPRGRRSDEPVSLVRKESLARLDGMLQRHIAAEKDTMRRITSTAKGR